MKVCIFGNKSTTSTLLRHLQASGIEVAALVTLNENARARVDISGADNAISGLAAEMGIKVLQAEKYSLSSTGDRQMFAAHGFDIGLCTGWQRLIPDSVLSQFRHGVFGWHGSGFRFPNGRGRSPLNWSIRLGLGTIYHNCFQYAPGVDDGNIFETEAIGINPTDYIADVQAKALDHIMASSLRLLSQAAGGTIALTEQMDHPFITFPALNEEAGFLSLPRLTRQEALNITRSCSRPFPGAFVRICEGGEKLRIWRLSELSPEHEPVLAPGDGLYENGTVFLGFCDGILMSEDFDVPQGDALANGRVFGCT